MTPQHDDEWNDQPREALPGTVYRNDGVRMCAACGAGGPINQYGLCLPCALHQEHAPAEQPDMQQVTVQRARDHRAQQWLWNELRNRLGSDEADQIRQVYADMQGGNGP